MSAAKKRVAIVPWSNSGHEQLSGEPQNWMVQHLDRKKGQRLKVAMFRAQDWSRVQVVAWIKRNPKLEYVEAPPLQRFLMRRSECRGSSG